MRYIVDGFLTRDTLGMLKTYGKRVTGDNPKHRARAWATEGFSTIEVKRWLDTGVFDPSIAAVWRAEACRHGFPPQDADFYASIIEILTDDELRQQPEFRRKFKCFTTALKILKMLSELRRRGIAAEPFDGPDGFIAGFVMKGKIYTGGGDHERDV